MLALASSRSACRAALCGRTCAAAFADVPSFRNAVQFPAPQTGGYGDVQYWNKRYAEQPEVTLDWFHGYSSFQPFVTKHIARTDRVLMAGCGNSAMSEDMVNDGYECIVNTDLSPVVIDNFRRRYAHVPQLSYMMMDARDMNEFQDACFDAVVDKGLADAMLCGVDPFQDVTRMLKETHRILRPGGVFMLITYGHPMIRMPALLEPGLDWSILMYILPKPGSKEDLEQTIEGTTADAVCMAPHNWQLGQEGLAGKSLTFIYLCTKCLLRC